MVVHRSNALSNKAYGSHFRSDEATICGTRLIPRLQAQSGLAFEVLEG